MSDEKLNPGDAIAQHITGLESQLSSEKIACAALQDELNDRAVELVTLGAQHRATKRINDGLVETVQKQLHEIKSNREAYTTTIQELQRQHNETRTQLERSERELAAERERPVGSPDFILHLIATQAASWLNQRVLLTFTHKAFTHKGLTRLQGLVLNAQTTSGEQIDLPVGLQEIVKAYCTTSRTAFDSDQLLADVSNYVENNRTSILELDAVQELFDFRQSLRDNAQTEKLAREHLKHIACPDVLAGFFVMTTDNPVVYREQHEHALLESVKEIAVSFIEDISFEIPISLE